jgi:SAM-dependent methyltransferase
VLRFRRRPDEVGDHTPSAAVPGIVACVVDDDPRLHLEALRWFATLTGLAGVDPSDLVVHAVGPTDSDALDLLRSKGVSIRGIELFDERSPHCNKIAGALSLAATAGAVPAVLSDADVVFCDDPRSVAVGPGAVALKPVDLPNPPLEVLRNVFAAASVPEPPTEALDFAKGETLQGNGNGGVYVVSAGTLGVLTERWASWARWLLDRRGLLGEFPVFVDQVALALALADGGIPVERLEARWNTPTNAVVGIPAEAATPSAIHYHQEVEPTGLLSRSGAPAVDARIEACNAAITALWKEAFPNRTFWEWRYRTDPALGSGVGSRGAPLADKRVLLESVLRTVRPTSTLDVGCGDAEATRGLAIPNYTGLDRSAEAVRLAGAARPGDTFLVGTLDEHPVVADLTVCLDVLIHQPDPDGYADLVARLVGSASRALLISGYEGRPVHDSPMIYFHEALSTTLARCAPDRTLRALRVEHEITTWLVEPPAGG